MLIRLNLNKILKLEAIVLMIAIALVIFFPRHRGSQPSPEIKTVYVHDTVNLAKAVSDSLTDEIKSKALRILQLEELVNRLKRAFKEVKPETVIIMDHTPITWPVSWEWVARTAKNKKKLEVVAFQVVQQDSSSRDSIIGIAKRYVFDLHSTDADFVLVTKSNQVFVKEQRPSLLSLKARLLWGAGVTADLENHRLSYLIFKPELEIFKSIVISPYIQVPSFQSSLAGAGVEIFLKKE